MAIVNGYATLLEIKSVVGVPAADTADDTLLELAVETASRWIDHYTGRRFWIDSAVVARTYTATDWKTLAVDPISTLTGLVVKTDDNDDGVYETTWTINTDFRAAPSNAAANGVPWTELVAIASRTFPTSTSRRFPGVEVTAKGGWPTAPPSDIKHACLLQAARLWKRKDAPFGVAGSVDFGSEMRLLSALDPTVADLLAPYKRDWGIAVIGVPA
jgi:hypothetical protein